MKSVIYISTPTSGSASIHRIISAIVSKNLTYTGLPKVETGSPTIANFSISDKLYLIRGTKEVELPIYSNKFRYIVNFRDPRDILCNQYHWLVQHPPGGEQDIDKQRKIIAERKARYDLGIDASVLRVKDDNVFNFVFELQKAQKAGADVLFVSYAQLCLRFELMVERIIDYLGMSPSNESLNKIELEHPKNLSNNPNWIGQNWTGTDVMPGRFQNELKRDTINVINVRFKKTLEILQEIEIPELKYLYNAS